MREATPIPHDTQCPEQTRPPEQAEQGAGTGEQEWGVAVNKQAGSFLSG